MAQKERVTEVIDRDTFKTASRKHPVRLANFDAPERRTPGAGRDKRTLEKLILDKEVSIHTVARDVYGRSVANVKVGRKSVNKAMRSGKKQRLVSP